MPLAGRPLAEWSLRACREAGSVGAIVVAAPPGHEQQLGGSRTGAVEGVSLDIVEGGATRAQSVANALRVVETEMVAVHDAARPLLTPDLLDDVVALLESDPEADGAIAATPVTDTTKQTEGRVGGSPTDTGVNRPLVVAGTLDREKLWAAQTPQAFRAEALRRAFEAAGPKGLGSATDDAMLIERSGGRVLIHQAPQDNIKVTTPADLRLAELLLDQRA